LERGFVFLEIARQLGLDGGLVAGEGAGEPARYFGVAADPGILLFDARLGLPVLDPDGKGPLTLARARSLPPDSAALPPVKEPSRLTLQVSYPARALVPRLHFLEQQLAPHVPVKLGVDALGRIKALQDAFPGMVRAWARPAGSGEDDPLSRPMRQLETFVDTVGFQGFYADLVPPVALPADLRQELPGQPGQMLDRLIAGPFVRLATAPGFGRDLVLRGRLDEAARSLVAFRDQVRSGRQETKDIPDFDRVVAAWVRGVREAYAAQDRERINALWKDPLPATLVYRAVVEPLEAAVTFQLALTRHEQAERVALAGEGSSSGLAWQSAAEWWDVFLRNHPDAPAAPAAALNRARALEMLGSRADARALLAAWSARAADTDRPAFEARLRQLGRE
jgi:hypothetical protein